MVVRAHVVAGAVAVDDALTDGGYEAEEDATQHTQHNAHRGVEHKNLLICTPQNAEMRFSLRS